MCGQMPAPAPALARGPAQLLPLQHSGSLSSARLMLPGSPSSELARVGLNLDRSPFLQVCLLDAAFAGPLLRSAPSRGWEA